MFWFHTRDEARREDEVFSVKCVAGDLLRIPAGTKHWFDCGGLVETVDWYREHRDWWEPIKSGDYKRYYDEQYAARLA